MNEEDIWSRWESQSISIRAIPDQLLREAGPMAFPEKTDLPSTQVPDLDSSSVLIPTLHVDVDAGTWIERIGIDPCDDLPLRSSFQTG